MSAGVGRLAALVLWAATSGAAAQESDRADGSARRPALERRAGELPRAELGRWSDLSERIANGEGTAGLAPEWLAGLSEVEGLYRSADYPGALERLWGLLDAAPELPPAMLLLGTTYYRLRRYEDAVAAFDRFLVHSPQEAWRAQARGHCLFGLGRFEAAIEQYERVLERVPQSVHARRGLGLSLYELGDLERAEDELAAALELDEQAAEVLEALARVRLDLEAPESALELLERAAARAPERPRVWFLKARALRELGEDDSAAATEAIWARVDRLAQAERAVAGRVLFASRDAALLAELSQLRAALGDHAGAAAALERALRSLDSPSRADLFTRVLHAADESRAALGPRTEFDAWRTALLERFAAEHPDDPRPRLAR